MIRFALNVTLFLYVFGVFIFSKVEGLSLATNVALLCLLVVLAIKGLRTGLAGLKYSLIILPLAFILFLSIFWSRYPVEAFVSFASFLTAAVGGMAVMLALMNGTNPKSVFWAAFLGSAYLVYSAWQERMLLVLSRVAGIAGNANELAIALILAAILISAECLNQSRWPKVYSLFLLIFSIYVTGSRKTVLVLILLCVFLFFKLFYKIIQAKPLKILLYMILIFPSILIVLGPIAWDSFSRTETYQRSIEGISGLDSSANIRKDMISEGTALWQKNPIIGYGINHFRYMSSYNTYSHNNYIEMLVSAGIIGFIAFYFIPFCLLCITVSKGRKEINIYSVFLILVLLLWDIAGVYYYNKGIWLLYGYLIYDITKNFSPKEGKMGVCYLHKVNIRKVYDSV